MPTLDLMTGRLDDDPRFSFHYQLPWRVVTRSVSGLHGQLHVRKVTNEVLGWLPMGWTWRVVHALPHGIKPCQERSKPFYSSVLSAGTCNYTPKT